MGQSGGGGMQGEQYGRRGSVSGDSLYATVIKTWHESKVFIFDRAQ